MKTRAKTESLAEKHHPVSIRQRLEDRLTHESLLGDFILGAIDGCVTTFAVVAGVAGAGLSNSVALVLGLANLVADGFSMAAGNYQKAQSDRELIAKARRIEEEHIAEVPEGEREEIRQIFAKKGFEGALLEEVVRVITNDRERWIDIMLTEELGLQRQSIDPLRVASVTFAAFVLVGSVPLLPFLAPAALDAAGTFRASAIATAAAFFAIGCVKGRMRHRSVPLSGFETLLLGGAAAALSYAIGVFLRGLT